MERTHWSLSVEMLLIVLALTMIVLGVWTMAY
jgi:hypothetical protein